MAYSKNEILEKVYAARSNDERREAYNDWASNYDQDVSTFGIQLPYVGASVFSRHVEIGQGKILDAGCGTGMHSLPLKLMGYSNFHGIDISEGMLDIAKSRNIYETLRQMALGERLNFSDGHFDVTYSIGCLAPGNAPPHSLDEFLRVTKSGGLIIWSTHSHVNEQTQVFHDYRNALTDTKKWNMVFETKPFVSMPTGDNNIKHSIYVYRVN